MEGETKQMTGHLYKLCPATIQISYSPYCICSSLFLHEKMVPKFAYFSKGKSGKKIKSMTKQWNHYNQYFRGFKCKKTHLNTMVLRKKERYHCTSKVIKRKKKPSELSVDCAVLSTERPPTRVFLQGLPPQQKAAYLRPCRSPQMRQERGVSPVYPTARC